jgi:hypothetical protein
MLAVYLPQKALHSAARAVWGLSRNVRPAWIGGLGVAVVLIALLGAALIFVAMVFYVIRLTWLWDHLIESEALLVVVLASCVARILMLSIRATRGTPRARRL